MPPPRKVTKLTADVTLNPGGKDLMRAFPDGNMFSLGTFATLTDVRAAFAVAQGEIERGIINPPAARPSPVDQTGARWGPLTGSPATAPTLSSAERDRVHAVFREAGRTPVPWTTRKHPAYVVSGGGLQPAHVMGDRAHSSRVDHPRPRGLGLGVLDAPDLLSAGPADGRDRAGPHWGACAPTGRTRPRSNLGCTTSGLPPTCC